MKNRLSCNREQLALRISFGAWSVLILLCLSAGVAQASAGGNAPPWMHSLTSVSLPAYDEKIEAVQLYSETAVIVESVTKIRTRTREAYKILRPEGRTTGQFMCLSKQLLRKSPSCVDGAFRRREKTSR